MTADEFQKIMVALRYMQGYNMNGMMYLPAPAVLDVIHKQLHQEDRGRFTWNPTAMAWEEKIQD